MKIEPDNIYVASCIMGLEQIVAYDIKDHLNALILSIDNGKITFYTKSNPKKCFKLRSIENLFLFLDEFSIGPTKNDLEYFKKKIKSIDLEKYFRLIKEIYGIKSGGPSFRCTGERTGQHEYTSMDLASEAGAVIKKKYQLKVDLENFDYEIYIHVHHDKCFVGGKITRVALHKRPYRIKYHPAMLNSTIAYCMCILSNIDDNDIFLDPFCGSGTILIERALFYNVNEIVGVEINPNFLNIAYEHILNANINKNKINLILGDSRFIPTKNYIFNKIVSNLPFGRRCGSHKLNLTIYPKLFKEINRVTDNKFIIIFLTLEKKLIRKLVNEHDLIIYKEIPLNHGGLYPSIFVITPSNYLNLKYEWENIKIDYPLEQILNNLF